MKETGMGVPNEYVAVLIKAMLAHGASWNGWDQLFQGILGISGNSAKNALHRYLGYGEPDVERVKECTKEQTMYKKHEGEMLKYLMDACGINVQS